MKYNVKFKPSAVKQLKKIDKKQAGRIVAKIHLLGEEPFPAASTPLVGTDAYRMRVGEYRVIYQVDGNELLVLVIRIGHRREVYKV